MLRRGPLDRARERGLRCALALPRHFFTSEDRLKPFTGKKGGKQGKKTYEATETGTSWFFLVSPLGAFHNDAAVA